MVDSTDSTSAIMDLTFNHEHERNTVDVKIYSQLASLDSSAFCLFVCVYTSSDTLSTIQVDL